MKNIMKLEIPMTEEGRFGMEHAGVLVIPMPFIVQSSVENASGCFFVHMTILQRQLRKMKELGEYDDDHPIARLIKQADAIERHGEMLARILASGIIMKSEEVKWSDT